MSQMKRSEIISNDVLMGLMGKACHCHATPFEHFNISNEEVDVVLTINGVEVPGGAGFLQAYYRQYEKIIAQRVRSTVENELGSVRKAVDKVYDAAMEALEHVCGSKESSDG